MTVPNNQTFNESSHLSVSDVAVDDAPNPAVLQIKIKQSKTDPFRRGVYLNVGRTGSNLCAVAAMLDYLSVRGMSPCRPSVSVKDGRVLSHQLFVEAVCDGLRKAGIDQDKYCGHSFHIGAATTAAVKGIEDSLIKTLGRWESLAYLQYVKLP